MSVQNKFMRYEMKYLVNDEQRSIIEAVMREYTSPDAYGKSTICSIYLDTPTKALIRRSMEHPAYKEKLRLRSYGRVAPNDKVFLELKKKYDSVVYKRRISLSERSAMAYLCGGANLKKQSQISREIDYFMSLYDDLKPAVFISYERDAFYAVDDETFRITFDRNILWRDNDLSLTKGAYGDPLLPDNMSLMELKVSSAIPLWMVRTLSENKIYKTSFSKYGSAYIASNRSDKINFSKELCNA